MCGKFPWRLKEQHNSELGQQLEVGAGQGAGDWPDCVFHRKSWMHTYKLSAEGFWRGQEDSPVGLHIWSSVSWVQNGCGE